MFKKFFIVLFIVCCTFLQLIGQSIVVSPISGTVQACAGANSDGSYIQSFTFSATSVTNAVSITAPTGFEISLNNATGYATSLSVNPVGNTIATTSVFVRLNATANIGLLTGQISLSTNGASSKSISVTGLINALPTISTLSNIEVVSGETVPEISFQSTGGTQLYNWTNDLTAIGVPASGVGNIRSFKAQNTGNTPIVANVSVTARGEGLAYMPGFGSNFLVVNPITQLPVDTIMLSSIPYAISVSPDGKRVYVAHGDYDNVSVISTSTNSVIATIPVGDYPLGILVSADSKRVYVSNKFSNTVSVINTNTNAVTSTIPLSENFPRAMAFNTSGAKLYVACASKVIVVDLNTAQQSAVISVGNVLSYLMGIAVNPTDDKIYVADGGALQNKVYVINGNTLTVTGSINVSANPNSIVISADGSKGYVSATDAHVINVLNLVNQTVTGSISVQQFPLALSLNPDERWLCTVSSFDQSAAIISVATQTVAKKLGTTGLSIGNYFSNGTGCTGNAITFQIKVLPKPIISLPNPWGKISSCQDATDDPNNLTELHISAINIIDSITVLAPVPFEISIDGNAFQSKVKLLSAPNGIVNDAVVYARLKNGTLPGVYIDSLKLATPRAKNQAIKLRGQVYPALQINPVADLTYTDATYSGLYTNRLDFSGVGNDFLWTNDNPNIGLPITGRGSIPPFIPLGNDTTIVEANIMASPSQANYAYFINEGFGLNDRYLTALNYQTFETVFQVPLTFYANDALPSPDGKYVAVTYSQDKRVKIFSTQKNDWISEYALQGVATSMAFSPDGKTLYIGNRVNYSISIINMETQQIVHVNINSEPASIVISPDGKRLYIGTTSSYLFVMNTVTRSVQNLYLASSDLSDMAIDTEGKRLYISSTYSNRVIVLNALTGQLIKNIPVEKPVNLALTPDDSNLYVTSTLLNKIYVIDVKAISLVSSTTVGQGPKGVAFDIHGSKAYIVNYLSNSISIVETTGHSVVNEIPVSTRPLAKHNFILGGLACSAPSISFKIKVVPRPAEIFAPVQEGAIETCFGEPSSELKHITVGGSQLKLPVIVTTTSDFEISLSPNSGFGHYLSLAPNKKGILDSIVVFVRTSAVAPVGRLLDSVKLESSELTPRFARITAIVTALPILNPLPDLSFVHGDTTDVINLLGTGGALNYDWLNNEKSIGLSSGGVGSINPFVVNNASGSSVTATIQVQARMVVYAYTISDDSINVINTETRKLEKKIAVGEAPRSLAITPDGKRIYVSNNGDGTISVINTSLNRVTETLAVGAYPAQLLMNPLGTKLYARVGQTTQLIDVQTNKTIATIPSYDAHLKISEDGQSLWVLRAQFSRYPTTGTISGIVYNAETLVQKSWFHMPADGFVMNWEHTALADSKFFVYLWEDPNYYVRFERRLLVYSFEGMAGDGFFQPLVNSIPTNFSLIHFFRSEERGYLYIADDKLHLFNTQTLQVEKTYNFNIINNSLVTNGLVYIKGWQNFSVLDLETQTMRANVAVPAAVNNDYDFGVSPSVGCLSAPATFNITVHPEGYVLPKIEVANLSGPIGACQGDPQKTVLRQIAVTGKNLSAPVVVTAPHPFEISTSSGGPYSSSVSFVPVVAEVDSILFIRLKQSTNAGKYFGELILSSAGANSKSLYIDGLVSAYPFLQSTALPNGEFNTDYSYIFTTSVAGFTFSATNLISGLTLTTGGYLYGKPQQAVESSEVVITASNAFCTQTEKYFLTIKKKNASINIYNTTHTYDGTGKQVVVQTTPLGIPVTITYDGSPQLPTEAGYHSVVVTVNSPNYQGSASGQIGIAPVPLVAAITGTSQTYTGTGVSVTVATTPSGVPLKVYYNGSQTLPVNPGTYSVLVSCANSNYTGSKSGTLTIGKASLTATANSFSIPYRGSFPVLSLTYSGFVNGETESVIDTKPILNTTATQNSNAGIYPITLSGGSDNNYSLTLQPGNLTITKADATVIATSVASVYGNNLPTLNFVISGLLAGETQAVIDTKPSISTTATVGSHAGTYPINLSGGVDNNYNLALIPGVLTISKADLRITANPLSVGYDDPLPGLTYSLSGLKNNDTQNDVDILPTISTTATQGSNAGVYAITLAGGSDNNYSLLLEPSELTITKKTPAISFENIADKLSNDAPFAISATAEFQKPIAFNIVSGPAQISGNLITLLGDAGVVTVRAQTTEEINFFANSLDQSFNVNLVLATEPVTQREIPIYPNPASTKLRIVLSESFSGAKIYLTEPKGTLVHDLSYSVDSEIDVSSFARGMYFIKIVKDKKVMHCKVIFN